MPMQHVQNDQADGRMDHGAMTTVGEVNHERNGFDPPLEPAFADQLGVRLGVPDYVPGIGRSRESRTPVPVKLMSCATPKIHIA